MVTYFERFQDVPFAFDTQLDIVEGLRSGRGIVYVFTFDERYHLTGE